MNVLTRNKIKLNWYILYVGIKKNWINTEEIIEFSCKESEYYSLLEKEIIKLNTCDKEDKYNILKIVELIITKLYGKDILSDINKFQNAERLWQLGFLLEIKNSDVNVNEKLKKIAELWANFNYPKEWIKFIYYMPIDNKEVESIGNKELILYQNFLFFLEKEKKILLEKQ